jgi:hypothetical protein
MPHNVCEERLHLVDQLAIKAGLMSAALARINALLAADGNIPAAQKSAEMLSLRTEVQMLMQEWTRTHADLESHIQTHQC